MSAGTETTFCSGGLYEQVVSCAPLDCPLDAGGDWALLGLSYDVSGQDLYGVGTALLVISKSGGGLCAHGGVWTSDQGRAHVLGRT